MELLSILTMLLIFYYPVFSYNGEFAERECPDDCECHYFRINLVTDCSNSNLTEIPYDELSKETYILDMNDNKIEEMRPFPLDFKIRRLQLANNLLLEVKKESFSNLHYLIDADFSENNIKKIDKDAFDDSPGFLTLELQDNKLDPVEGVFLSVKTLLYLDISNCNLMDLNVNFFDNLTVLSTLDLSGNPLGKLNSLVLDPLTSLETLKINDCNLTYISNDAFNELYYLKHLEISGNNLYETDWSVVLGPLKHLEYIDVKKSGITNLPAMTFVNNVYLRTIIVAENNLIDFDVSSTIGHLQELDTLDFSFCNLSQPLSEEAFMNATKIRELYLSGNTLFASDLLLALAPLYNLEKLSLSNCSLSRLPDTFRHFKSIKELDISHNPLNDVFVKILSPLDTLEYLNMGYSNLQHLAPTSFSKMTHMKKIILSGNDLYSLEAGLFSNLTRLESLELNFCGLRRPINATLFFNNFTYTDLTEMELAGNPLKVSKSGPLLPKQLSRLRILNLSNCNLTFLTDDAFYWTRNITTLILSGNRFASPSSLKFLELLPQLEILDLKYNNLTSLSRKEISFNSQISKLKLIGNPWKCGCGLVEIWDWASLEKEDLTILEGSVIAAEHIIPGKSNKKKKLLECSYDTLKQTLPFVVNKTSPGRRPFLKPQRVLTSPNRTWAKYVRESDCEPLKRSERKKREVETDLYNIKDLPTNEWAAAAINAGLVYVSLMVVVVVVFLYRNKRGSNSNKGDCKYN